MQVIVPLAGPDFVSPDGRVKALHDQGYGPLLSQALQSRAWSTQVAPEDYCFVLYDQLETRAFVRDFLMLWYPGCKVVFISNFTAGAALSALAGAALQLGTQNSPIIIDLADILYDSQIDPVTIFAKSASTGGIAWTFPDTSPVYSYLRKDNQGRVVEAAEKRVISNEASAGTYGFSSGSVLLRAIAHALENAETQTFRDLFFVCPLYNGVLDQGLDVQTISVSNVKDIKISGTTS